MNAPHLPADRRAVHQNAPIRKPLWQPPPEPIFARWYEREEMLDATTPEIPELH